MDLASRSSLPIHLNPARQLDFGPGVVVDEFKIRPLSALVKVFLDSDACQGDDVAYRMYNGVYHSNDAARLQDTGMRYELTLFPDLRVGGEYIKTLGHIHLPEPRSGIDPPEICEVLLGTAHFFFQKFDTRRQAALETFFVEVNAREKIVIPPGYHHLTINPGPGPMLFSDVVALGVGGDYAGFQSAGGAAYLEVEAPSGPRFIPNPRYHSVPPLQRLEPRQLPNLDLSPANPLYRAFVETRGELWGFLKQPELFAQAFPSVDELFA